MFILSLRGRFGISIALGLHGLAALLTIVLLGSTSFGLRLTVLLIFIAGSVFILRYMNLNKERLIFNSTANRQVAFPSSPKIEKTIAYYQGVIVVIFFCPLVAISLLGNGPSEVPTGVIFPIFYLATLAFIGILQNVVRGRAQ
jgi:hypothetical protein